jgi:prepilin-type processing-associated H-X9-DG protein
MTSPAEQAIANVAFEGRELHVALASGRHFVLPAGRLRAACRCAHCRRAQIDGVFPGHFEAIAVAQVAPMGHYGINIAFSDGHARGIFPWSYLAELAADLPRE